MQNRMKRNPFPFTAVPNELICNPEITAKSKAIYCYLLSRPDNWIFYTEEIANNFKEGREAIASALKELIDFGWIAKEQIRKEDGTFSHNEYEIFPSPNYAVTENTVNGKAVNGKSSTNNTNNNKNDNNKKIYKKDLPKKIPLGFEYPEEFKNLWESYKHTNKGDKWNAYRAYMQALKLVSHTDIKTIIEAEMSKEFGKRHMSTILNSDLKSTLEDINKKANTIQTGSGFTEEEICRINNIPYKPKK